MNKPANLPPPSTDPRNLEGSYIHLSMLRRGRTEAPYKPETLAKITERERITASGTQIGSLFDLCRQGGIVTDLSLNFPFQIVQTDREVILLFEEMHSRLRILLNQELPKNVPTSYMGYSVGHWDGDTLVATTVGVDPRTYLGLDYVPHGEKLRIETRIRKIDGGSKIEIVFTFDDPDFYTRPWSPAALPMDWRPDLNKFAEYDCEETTGTASDAQRYGVKIAP
jgi:hypothetical protein